ncbi:MAG: DNA-processing protein DprA [Firmicutes bacterium]|nr:DNA-processing protein DprA [Bacillota bacterium]MCL1954041.1 DNA-processing protein DprA [Bacillota bacterium]
MNITPDIVYHWMSLASISIAKQNTLLQLCGSAVCVWEDFYCNDKIKCTLGDKYIVLDKLRDIEHLNTNLQELYNQGIQLVCIENTAYPKSLKHVYDPPNLLYALGDLSLFDTKCIAVVGTRHSTSYGQIATKIIVKQLVENGVTIVSGLATGIDTYAHRQAIESNGKTIAIIAGGFNHIHPSTNNNLSKQISQIGLLVSEYTPQTVPQPYMFIARNRIVSGISNGILVVEAGQKSGAKITANLGLEQGKQIYCVPGPINSSQSIGTNQLIQDGAMLVTSGQDIVQDLGWQSSTNTKNDKIKPVLDFFEQQVYNLLLAKGKTSFDNIVEELNCNSRELSVLLSNLEMRDIVAKLAGNSWQLIGGI